MKEIQNEKGIALITAILTIVVFSILGLAMVTMTEQGLKQRDFSNEQAEGKMLADTGLLYFQKYLEKNLNFNDSTIQSAIKSPNDDDDLMGAIKLKFPNQSGTRISLPDGKGAFQIQYQVVDLKDINGDPVSAFPYQDENDTYIQPYVRKLHVTVTGIPADTSHFKNVMLTATVYINTIASPFHYAISTPNELNLFGGSNIIGNVTAKQVNVSTQFSDSNYKSDPDDPQKYKDVYEINIGDSTNNQPYVEGKIKLNGNEAKLQRGTLTPNTSDKPTFNSNPDLNLALTDRQSLRSIGLFMPRGQIDESGIVSANPMAPYIPGTEPPLVEKLSVPTNNTLKFFTPDNPSANLREYIKYQFQKNEIPDPKDSSIVVNDLSPTNALDPTTQPIWIASSSNINDQSGFRTADFSKFTFPNAVIYTNQNNIKTNNEINSKPYLLTARLTGDELKKQGFTSLFIGPDPIDTNAYEAKNASVEMGNGISFENASIEGPFSFDGSIFIKGNLDIVGDITVNGTIFVDGDVNIRENGGGTDYSNAPNLVILSTGKITITNRNIDAVNDQGIIDWTKVSRLGAFLYSDNYPIEIYSNKSVNWLYGGLATGTGENNKNSNDNNTAPKPHPPYIELDTARKQDDYASHMIIQFSRGIFEQETPGLPSANQFYCDTYDIIYTLH